jgi:hypothetical protein
MMRRIQLLERKDGCMNKTEAISKVFAAYVIYAVRAPELCDIDHDVYIPDPTRLKPLEVLIGRSIEETELSFRVEVDGSYYYKSKADLLGEIERSLLA